MLDAIVQRVEHVASEDCPCNPVVKPVEREDGSIGWVYVHHA